jgi:hypothetical protein
MRHVIAAAFGLASAALLSAGPSFSQTVDKPAFQAMCAKVSVADKLPSDAIAPFCGCLTEQAAKDGAVYKELWSAAKSEPSADARMAKLSEPAAAAVQACRAMPNSAPKSN